MNCAKCGMELPDSAKYCPGCGMMNEAGRAVPPQKRKMKPVIYAIAGLAAIALIALAFVAIARIGQKNVTSVPESPSVPPGNILSAPPGQSSGGNITSASPGTPGPGDTAPSSLPKPKPPKEVVDYLNFVSKVEAVRRQAIVNSDLDKELLNEAHDMLGDMFTIAGNVDATNEDPMSRISEKLNRRAAAMMALLKCFDKAPAPMQCREFSGAYRRLLYVETNTIYHAATSIPNVNLASADEWRKYADASNAQAKDNQAVKDASNGVLADDADGKLNQVVSSYDMPKPFEVSREKPAGGGIMGF